MISRSAGVLWASRLKKADRSKVAQRVKKMDWPKPVIDRKTCVSCGLCITICPVSCLALDYDQADGSSRGYPHLAQPNACIACAFCADICPVTAISLQPNKKV